MAICFWFLATVIHQKISRVSLPHCQPANPGLHLVGPLLHAAAQRLLERGSVGNSNNLAPMLLPAGTRMLEMRCRI